jgi:hypothetical protein
MAAGSAERTGGLLIDYTPIQTLSAAVTSAHSGTNAFALWSEKSGGTSNLPV